MDEMKGLTIKLPNQEHHTFEYGKPIILLGANGAGKTRFSVKIEDLNDKAFSRNLPPNQSSVFIHRISAQKSLAIDESITIHDYESSQSELFIGNANPGSTKNGSRFQYKPATGLLNDYNKALSLLFAEANKELQIANREDILAVQNDTPRPQPAITKVHRAEKIWNDLLPHRTIDFTGNGVHAGFNGQSYHGKEMSDGERVMLYMIAQVLVQRPNTLIIIDEPELHIHKSLVDKLWTRLEQERPDCVFMYITHDLNFVSSRNNAEVFWIKSYDGTKWEYEILDSGEYDDIPKELLYELVGSRQKILFVEGTKESLDYKIYQELYGEKDYHIIPCSSCDEVITLVKAKSKYEVLNDIKVCGIIDRDFRSERQLTSLEKQGIYCLNVAEVENLFVVPEILTIMEKRFACEGVAKKAEESIKVFYEERKEHQIAKSFAKEMEFQFSLLELGKEIRTASEVKKLLDEKYSREYIEKLLNQKTDLFNSKTTLPEILTVFNCKALLSRAEREFEFTKGAYPNRILNILRNKEGEWEAILEVLKKYTPDLP